MRPLRADAAVEAILRPWIESLSSPACASCGWPYISDDLFPHLTEEVDERGRVSSAALLLLCADCYKAVQETARPAHLSVVR